MNIFKGFSYRLLRSFALTTLISGIMLMYMGFQATRGNVMFMTASIIMFLITVVLAYFSWQNYQHRPISVRENCEVYTTVCPSCGEMLTAQDELCPHCGERIS